MSWHKMLFVIKIEAHIKRNELEYQGNALTDFHTKAATKNKM